MWPGIFIPPIPTKNYLNNFEAPFIEKRRKLLETFLVRIFMRPSLYDSQIVKEFVRPSGDNKEFTRSQTLADKEDKNDDNFKSVEINSLVDSYWPETHQL